MLKRLSILVLIPAALAAAPAAAQPSSEWLAQAALPGFVIGFRESDGSSMIVERVPTGETVERWTRMVTIQRLARRVRLEIWTIGFTHDAGESCPGMRYSGPVYSEFNGRPAVAFRGDCPLNPTTGQPETLLLRAIATPSALHVAQVAFRHVPSEAETAWALSHLATIVLCSRDVATPTCRAAP
jgi:hypothetical protein